MLFTTVRVGPAGESGIPPEKAGGGIGIVRVGAGRNGSTSPGRLGVTPGESRRRMYGVIITTSSVVFFLYAWLRNSLPRIGISPMPGTRRSVSSMLRSSSPEIANVWPSRSSTSVSVRRVESDGTRKPSMVTPLAKSSVLTSGITFRSTCPPPVIVGVNRRRTPNSLKTIVTDWLAPPPWTTGYGNSPPARKLASFPSCVTRFGSARLSKSPLPLSARMVTPSVSFI